MWRPMPPCFVPAAAPAAHTAPGDLPQHNTGNQRGTPDGRAHPRPGSTPATGPSHGDGAAANRHQEATTPAGRTRSAIKRVPTRTGPCCTPSTISCHSYGLASHQVLERSCPILHNFRQKIVKYGSFTQILIPCNNQLPSTIAQIQIIHTEGFQGCLRSRVDTQQLLSTRWSSHGAHGDTGVGHVHRIARMK